MNKNDAAALREFAPGAITRIAMHNFLTYSDVNFKVGPKLNIVLGPNGSGKSSIVCAIALSLGGAPKLLGRSENLCDFIMHEKNDAWVEVELELADPGRRLVVRREFSRIKLSSVWKLNGQIFTEKKAKDKIIALGIIIENLCTFLPQDRVGDFSGYNPQQIMTETCKAVDESALFVPHQDLIKMSQTVGSRIAELQQVSDEYEQAVAQNELLKAEVDRMNQRQMYVNKMMLLKQRRAWLEFDVLRGKAQVMRDNLNKLQEEYKTVVENDRPLQDALESAKEKLEKCMISQDKCKVAQAKLQQDRDFQLEELPKLQESITALLGRAAAEEDRKKHKEAKRKELANTVQRCQQELDMAQRNAADAENKIDELTEIVRSLDEEQQDLEGENRRMNGEMYKASEDVRHARSIFESVSKDNYRFKSHSRAAPFLNLRQWIDQNKDMFDEPVYGPIAMEVNITDKDMSRCLENHVSFNIWSAFVTTNFHDRRVLSDYVRSKQLSVTVLNCESGDLRDCTNQQPFRPDSLHAMKSEVGELIYLDSTFTAPNPVRQMLRDHSGVHTVLIGKQHLEARLGDKSVDYARILAEGDSGMGRNTMVYTISPPLENSGFSYIQGYSIKVSIYSGKITSTVREIASMINILGGGVDEEAKSRAIANLKMCEENLNEASERLESSKRELANVNSKKEEASKSRTNNLNIIKLAKSLKSKFATLQQKLAAVTEELENWVSREREVISKDLVRCVKKQGEVTRKLQSILKKIILGHSSLIIARVIYDEAHNEVEEANARVLDAQERSRDMKSNVDKCSVEFSRAKLVLKETKRKCDQVAPLRDSNGEFLPLRDELEALPDDLDEIDEEYARCEQQVRTSAENPQVVQRYEEGKLTIEALKKLLDELEASTSEESTMVSRIRDPWENRLKRTVDELDASFSMYMDEMGCGGNIRLAKHKDFSKWGIEICVRFRNQGSSDGAMKVLNAEIHSGGERSVSTILYLMAMQDLHRSPFRVVDEVNQGMDQHNERLVFSRIVRNSCGPTCPQFFLITPKLLQGLISMDNPYVTLLFIFNGPYSLPGDQPFSMRKFIELTHKKRKESEEKSSSTKRNMRKLKR